LLIAIVDNKATSMQLELGNSNTCFLCTLCLNCKRTALVFAKENIALSICLIDSIGLAIIKYITINGFARLCNSCKCVIKGNHSSNDKAITANRCKSYLQHYIYSKGGLGQMTV
jgi:hypothetical protein